MRASLLLLSLLFCAASVHAQFLPFGRNKINYAGLDWHILKTEHFDIYFYPEMEELARKGGHFAEESYAKLEQEFNFTLTDRVPLIFYSTALHFQQTNITPGFIPEGVGGFFEFLQGRVVIPNQGSLEQFRHVINHELVHVFMHNKVERTLYDYQLQTDRYPPLWFVEGLAEYYSMDWDSQGEMLLRDGVLHGYFFPLSTIWAISGSFLMYKEGQSALMFMEKQYGKETILKLIDNIWKSPSFSDVMKVTIGKTYEEFDREWIAYLKKQYYPLVDSLDRSSDVTVEIIGNGFQFKPVFFRDQKASGTDSLYVVYISNATGYTSLYKKSLRGGPARLLVEGEKTDEFEAFHPFQSKMSVSNGGVLAFVTKSGERDNLHLYDLNREELDSTLEFPELVMLSSPSWSPDGRQLVFSGISASGESDLYIVDLDTRRLLQLTNDHYDDREPAWSPDGASIVFASDRTPYGKHGRHNLFSFDVENRTMAYLAYGDANYTAPSWSKDGHLLTFTSDRDGIQNVYVMDVRKDIAPNGNRIRQATRFLTSAFDPVWTESGSLMFGAFDAYSFQIRGIRDVAANVDSLPVIDLPMEGIHQTAWSIPPVAGESSGTPLRYEKEYSLDIAQSQISTDPVFGTIGGAALSLSDVLGNDRYYFLLYNTAQTSSEILSSFNVAISRISLEHRNPYAYGIFHFSGRRYDLLDPDRYFFERAFGGYFVIAHPLSQFERFEGSVTVTNSDKEAIEETRRRKALLLTHSISFIHDNALYYYTGPIDGSRYNVTLAYTTDIQYNNVNFFSAMADYRHYFRLGLRSAVATRAEILYNNGKEARRFFLGGSWDLRGWPRWSIRGTKRWLTSVELRFPLLDRVGFDFPFGAIELGIMRGAFFFDAGNCWDDVYGETLGSIGAGLRFNLFGLLVLRYDFGKRVERNFTHIQDDMFHQFFFGWDF